MKMSRVQRLRAIIELAAGFLSDKEALEAVELFPEWKAGTAYTAQADRPVGHKVRREGRLYRLRQEHTAQVGWEPENAASLWEEICESHSGAADDPIPYSGNMALESGKYYAQDGVVYRCIRDTGTPVNNTLADLVGLYVEMIRSHSQSYGTIRSGMGDGSPHDMRTDIQKASLFAG